MCNDEYYELGERNRGKTDKAVIGQDHFFFFLHQTADVTALALEPIARKRFSFFLVEIFSGAITKTVGFFRNWVGFI